MDTKGHCFTKWIIIQAAKKEIWISIGYLQHSLKN